SLPTGREGINPAVTTEQGLEAPLFPVLKQGKDGESAGSPVPSASRQVDSPQAQAVQQDDDEAVITEADLIEQEEQNDDEYIKGGYSPRLLQPGDLGIDEVIYDERKMPKKLAIARSQVCATEECGDRFSVEMTTLNHKHSSGLDKYRPRKPRFFNRVHTGFEWNKYNQTHYDIDNPPPKIVQGYKFNIFYPDLIDKTKTPEYTVDIAFKIVSREWEYSYKRGFRCQFQNNIFQLWFHFKRYRYRR
ncbi:hypothetical protein C0Q70_20628, partial [Pomacea canaliculata]